MIPCLNKEDDADDNDDGADVEVMRTKVLVTMVMTTTSMIINAICLLYP